MHKPLVARVGINPTEDNDQELNYCAVCIKTQMTLSTATFVSYMYQPLDKATMVLT